MMMKWSRLQLFILVGVVVLAVLSYAGGYYLYVSPIKNQVEATEQRLETQQQILNQQVEGKVSDELTTDLKRQLPTNEATDRLLLLLRQVEARSESTIAQISISESTSLDTITTSMEDLESITYQLLVSSPSFDQMHTFLSELESLDRLISINQLQFNQQDSEDYLNFSVSFSAYYNPTLIDIEIEAPLFDS